MTDERRYDEDEVREIFGRAAAERAPLPPGDGKAGDAAGSGDDAAPAGLTLPELQAIGREVGLDPRRVADAAALLELRRGRGVQRRSVIGAPLAVGRAVDLPRPLTDDEWAILVGEVRETFGARGRVASQAGLREWSNGQLHVVQEATETGHRLRLRTLKENGVVADRIGLALLGLAAVLLAVMVVTGLDPGELFGPLFLGAMGAAALASNALLLPPWARRRERQMEHIAARALALTRDDD